MKITPDQIVTEKIVAELRQKQLATQESTKELGEKLSVGNLSAEDWRLIAELALAKTGKSQNGKTD